MSLPYTIIGNGKHDILLIHGWASSQRMWESVTDAFHDVRFWAIDLAGFGDSPIPEKPPTIDDHLQSVIEFCTTHELHPKVIIAHSMGGLVTLKLAQVRPDLMEQIVLICPVVTGHFGLQGIASQILKTPLGAGVLRASAPIWKAIQQEYLLKVLITPWHINAELARRVQADFIQVHPASGIEALLSMAQTDMTPYLAEIRHPTLVIVGEQDLTVPPSEGKTLASHLPTAQLVLVADARHHPHDERTSETIPHIQAFLSQYGIS